jgi:hypothetical protein
MAEEENINKRDTGHGEVFFEWETPEYLKYARSLFWYIAVIGIGVILIIYSIFTANFLFALIIIIAAFIVFLKSYREPAMLLFQITEDGIVLGDQFFDYDRIKSFYFIYDPPAVKKLFFDLKGIAPTISVHLNNKNPLLIRKKLLEYLKEDTERKHQSLDDQLESILKM